MTVSLRSTLPVLSAVRLVGANEVLAAQLRALQMAGLAVTLPRALIGCAEESQSACVALNLSTQIIYNRGPGREGGWKQGYWRTRAQNAWIRCTDGRSSGGIDSGGGLGPIL